jgi:hypothetical protein
MRAENFGEKVYWDIWGPTSVKSLNSNSYVAARIDDATHKSKLYFQQKKSQTFKSYKRDKAHIETQTGHCTKASCSDWGGEFLSDAIINYQNQKGTVQELTVHDSPPQNSVSERGMRMWAKWAHALLLAFGLPHFLWEEVMNHSNWLQNRMLAHTLNGKTPYEVKNKRKPNLAGI